jgi:hypothetical protein
MSQQMTQRIQMSQRMLQCLSESDLNGSGSGANLISEDLQFSLGKEASLAEIVAPEEQKPVVDVQGKESEDFRTSDTNTKSTEDTNSREMRSSINTDNTAPRRVSFKNDLETDMACSIDGAANQERRDSLAAETRAIANDTTADAADPLLGQLTPAIILSDWQQLGFASEEQAQLLLALMSSDKTPEERQNLIVKL